MTGGSYQHISLLTMQQVSWYSQSLTSLASDRTSIASSGLKASISLSSDVTLIFNHQHHLQCTTTSSTLQFTTTTATTASTTILITMTMTTTATMATTATRTTTVVIEVCALVRWIVYMFFLLIHIFTILFNFVTDHDRFCPRY